LYYDDNGNYEIVVLTKKEHIVGFLKIKFTQQGSYAGNNGLCFILENQGNSIFAKFKIMVNQKRIREPITPLDNLSSV
jgi:peptidyl-tRNA hydrolase